MTTRLDRRIFSPPAPPALVGAARAHAHVGFGLGPHPGRQRPRAASALIGAGRQGHRRHARPPAARRRRYRRGVRRLRAEPGEGRGRRAEGGAASRTSGSCSIDKDIEAVIIGTPDHWHALMTVMACQAGKDVYVEKPTSVAIAEGRKMVEAARKYNRIVQVGTQQRSATHFQHAAELVRRRPHRRDHHGALLERRQLDARRHRQSARRRAAGRRSTGTCGSARRQRSPFNANRFGVVPDSVLALPLVLGLRRRHDDRLGRAPHRHRADGR